MFARSDIYFRLHLLLIIIYITCISLSLRRTSAPIYLTSVLGVLGTQETSCTVIAGLLERDSFDLLLPEFDKPWVIHLRETWCCSKNLCTWRPNTIYKNRRVRRHQSSVAQIEKYKTNESLEITWGMRTRNRRSKRRSENFHEFLRYSTEIYFRTATSPNLTFLQLEVLLGTKKK
jgi:hypothetical protein